MGKVFVFDHNKCNGCYGCQIACKDETCYNEWLPYSKPQPTTGQYWLRLEDVIHGQVPKVKLEYRPVMCQHCDNCPLLDVEPSVAYRRDDGLVILDPEKATDRELVDLCPYGAVFYNDELNVAQKCTGCAHLVDAGEVPHCVELCVLGALRFGDEEEFAEEIANAERLPGADEHTRVYYLNMPHLFIGGEVWDPSSNEEIEGAVVSLSGDAEAQTTTDEFGDFWFRKLDSGQYHVEIKAEGYKPAERDVFLDKSLNLGDFALERS